MGRLPASVWPLVPALVPARCLPGLHCHLHLLHGRRLLGPVQECALR